MEEKTIRFISVLGTIVLLYFFYCTVECSRAMDAHGQIRESYQSGYNVGYADGLKKGVGK